MAPFVNLFGPLDALHAWIVPILLVLLLANSATRILAHRRQVDQYDSGGAEAIARWPPHVATNLLLVLGSFYLLTVQHHAGVVTSMFVVTMVLTDFFEFEGRKVEARRDLSLDKPKAAIALWGFALLYVIFTLVASGPIDKFI